MSSSRSFSTQNMGKGKLFVSHGADDKWMRYNREAASSLFPLSGSSAILEICMAGKACSSHS